MARRKRDRNTALNIVCNAFRIISQYLFAGTAIGSILPIVRLLKLKMTP
jgi:hypothetical protein